MNTHAETLSLYEMTGLPTFIVCIIVLSLMLLMTAMCIRAVIKGTDAHRYSSRILLASLWMFVFGIASYAVAMMHVSYSLTGKSFPMDVFMLEFGLQSPRIVLPAIVALVGISIAFVLSLFRGSSRA